jgi:chromosomal replication initiator protein
MAALSDAEWSALLNEVRQKHPQLARAWFVDLQVVDLQQGTLTIRTRNESQTRYLHDQCRQAFTNAAQSVTGHFVAITFVTDEAGDREHVAHAVLDSPDEQLVLDPEFTFENFVTGPANRLAHAAAVAVAESPGTVYNPLFLHGSVGLGKTHLVQAIGNALRERDPDLRFCYLACDTFTNHFIDAVERGSLDQFRQRYRHVDVLAIDDVQFLSTRERSQEEFFHTFNALYQFHRQIVLTADVAPREIPGLAERLISRFNSGLVAMIDQPSFETRVAIVRRKAKLRCIEMPPEVCELIARRIDSNIRELEGALTKIDAFSRMQGEKPTLEMARSALGDEPERNVTVPAILEIVSRRLEVRVAELQSKKRARHITFPRHICMHLARRLTDDSLEQIGGYFGGRDHTTVLHASRTIDRQAEDDPELRALLDELTLDIKNAR